MNPNSSPNLNPNFFLLHPNPDSDSLSRDPNPNPNLAQKGLNLSSNRNQDSYCHITAPYLHTNWPDDRPGGGGMDG